MLFSAPQHGERIDYDGLATRQFHTYLEDLADLFDVNSLPDEAEIIFKNGAAELSLATFIQDIAEAAGVTPIEEGEKITESGMATFRFQAFLDQVAG